MGRSDRAQTSLSYLGSSADQSYLTNPEYAPNKFGDLGDYMRKKAIKVQTQNLDIARDGSTYAQIFANLSFHINGNTRPPMEELRKLILQRGGRVEPVLRNKGMVDYIIAPTLTQSKFREFARYKVATEGWIVECVMEGRLLDWTRWKLQVQGGWEESGRRGLEGFLKGSDGSRDAALTTPSMSVANGQGSSMAPSVSGAASSTLDVSAPIAGNAPSSPTTPHRNDSAITPGAALPITARLQRPEGPPEHHSNLEPNVEAGRRMRDTGWRAQHTAERGNEAGFIDGYYQNSRLHHLSTWKAELRTLVAAAQAQAEDRALILPTATTLMPTSFGKAVLPPTMGGRDSAVIFHVDFDAFFASASLKSRPHLKGKPVVVCHSIKGESSTSEIASASYEAREKGVRSGMSLGQALKLVGPELTTVP
ncbi:deoxycytidyl transferase [Cryptotrichosporon argae]